jgi:hypothetical protein
MSLHDFRCPLCDRIARDINVPIAVGALHAEIPCPACHTAMEWIPGIGLMDAANGPSFVGFDTMDGRNQPVHIDSLQKLRTVERESESMAKNGDGQQMVWRRFSNDASNVHQHTLKETPAGTPTEAAKRKFGRSTMKTHGETAPNTDYGPGVSDANTSALPLTGTD